MDKLEQICATFHLHLQDGVYVSDAPHLKTLPYDLWGPVILLNCTRSDIEETLPLRYTLDTTIFIHDTYKETNNEITYERIDWYNLTLSDFLVKANQEYTYDIVILSSTEDTGGNYFTLEPLQQVVKELRAPSGCPWDKIQTHSSLRRYFLEEVYEVLEAIDKEDLPNLREELGDVLLQVVFHARLAEERGDFSVQDVINDITEKMIRRHPNVFPKANSREIGDTLLTWEALKAKEKGFFRKNLLSGISTALPALLRAQKLQEKAAKVGFDWSDVQPMWDKFYEELDEFKEAIDEKSIKNIEIEGGDVLFSLINILRWYKISGENALSRTNTKFQQRFTYVETQVEKSGRSWKDFSLAELDEFWKAAKLQETDHSY